MILVRFLLFCFGVPIVLLVVAVAWLWFGKKLFCWVFSAI
jgi:hypothetical protein